MKKKVLLPLSVTAGILFLAFVAWVSYMASPTAGKPVGKYDAPRKALVIIDVQESTTGSLTPARHSYRNVAGMIAVINRAVNRATMTGMPVIVVDQEFGGIAGTLWSRFFVGGRLMKGAPGSATDARVDSRTAVRFTKPKGDAFSNPELDQYLHVNQINELYLTGVDAEFCVLLTARGAVNRGYKTAIISDGVGMLNENKRDKIMEKFGRYGVAVVKEFP